MTTSGAGAAGTLIKNTYRQDEAQVIAPPGRMPVVRPGPAARPSLTAVRAVPGSGANAAIYHEARCAVSETVEFGGWPRPPRWVWVVAGVAAVAVLAGVVVARRGPHHASASSPSATSPVHGSRTPAVGSAARWPSVEGACRVPVYLPRIHLARHQVPVHVAVLVGGTALREVIPGGALAGPLPGLPGQGRVVTKLVSGPGADYAFVDPQCSGYLWVYRIVAGAAHRLGTAAFDLLGGPHHAWAVTYPRHTLLTPLNGGRTITLKAGADPVADTAAGLVVAYRPRAGRPGTVELVDPNTGGLVRRLARGSPMGAAAGVVLVSRPGCGAPPASRLCTLESISLTTGQPTATFELPAGRLPVSDAVFSPSGTVAAFQLARARPDPRVTAGRPLPPADVTVLHLDTGSLDIVPGLELPPGTEAGLAFDTTGNWLLAAVSEGDHGELLAWRHGMPGPALMTSLPGPLMAAPPLLVAPSS
jgi:hypothetical protein